MVEACMGLIQKMLLFWSVFLVFIVIGEKLRTTEQAPILLPINTPITSIELPHNLTLTHQNNHWQANQQPANQLRIQTLLTLLQQPCQQRYSRHELSAQLSDNSALTFLINAQEYTIGAHHPFSQTNYIYYQEDVYLCSEKIKYFINQPIDYWVETKGK